MREEQVTRVGSDRELLREGADLDKKYPVALALYAILAALAWLTIGAEKILIDGRFIEIRLLPLIIIGGLVLRTVLARHADRIRRAGEKGSS
jgi:hypothetical protein